MLSWFSRCGSIRVFFAFVNSEMNFKFKFQVGSAVPRLKIGLSLLYSDIYFALRCALKYLSWPCGTQISYIWDACTQRYFWPRGGQRCFWIATKLWEYLGPALCPEEVLSLLCLEKAFTLLLSAKIPRYTECCGSLLKRLSNSYSPQAYSEFLVPTNYKVTNTIDVIRLMHDVPERSRA